MSGFKHRPKSLKVFVNPISHKKEAYQIYQDRVAPLFKLADIQTDVTGGELEFTESKGHALSILKECRLDEYDGSIQCGTVRPPAHETPAVVAQDQRVSHHMRKRGGALHSLRMGKKPPKSGFPSLLPRKEKWTCLSPLPLPDPFANPKNESEAKRGQNCEERWVVCVGGDGSVAEVAQGLLLRAQMEAERDTHSVFMPVPAPLPLGVIPAGSANVVACSVYGVKHPVTAALHIILGHRQPVDMCSMSSTGELLRFGFCAMVGFGSQVQAVAERLNWIPPMRRHELALLSALTQLRSELEEDLTNVEDDDEWQVRRGLYLSITIMSIPCMCSVAPKGLAPFTRMNNNSMALTAVANTSRSEFIKHLKRYSSSYNPFSFSFVEVQRVRAVKLRPLSHGDDEQRDSKHTPFIPSEGTLTWNIDGELLEVQGEVLIRVHTKLLTLFGSHVEEAEEPPANCSCI
ncbi:ceramide kinase-like protein [Silurus meridionalis]|nr:ceramide kinase-like protein [Silurus meridionalis]